MNRFLTHQSHGRLVVICVLLIGVIGTMDFMTGYELSFSIFYMIPVAVGSWYLGKRAGLVICFFSAATWLAADLSAGHVYSEILIPFWNATVRLAFFFITAYLLAQLRTALEAQASLAKLDGLTGILNGRAFIQSGGAIAKVAARHRHPLTLGYLDLDGFKDLNDTLGHDSGDQALKAIAGELTRRARASDVVGRLGGDEFAILLAETGSAGARVFFKDMKDSLAALAAQNGWPVGFSIGVVIFESPPANFEDTIKSADDLMYNVKRAGKNNVWFEERAAEPAASIAATLPLLRET